MMLNNLIEGIYGFDGEYRFLSNFWVEPDWYICYENLMYPSTEHAYQAAKTLIHAERVLFTQPITAGKAKRLGRQINLRDDWEIVKDRIMDEICFQKFKHPVLRQKLLATGDLYLEETNTWGDTYWGVCNGKGRNILGLTLMKIRKELNENNL